VLYLRKNILYVSLKKLLIMNRILLPSVINRINIQSFRVIIACLFLISHIVALGQAVTVSGANSASNGSYASLNTAFTAINAQDQTGNEITVEIHQSLTEGNTSSLTGAGGMWASLYVYPTVENISVSVGFSSYTIALNGAQNVIIDGRVNMEGSTADMIIQNSGAGQTQGGAITLINNAQNNTIRYCIIKSSIVNATANPLNGAIVRIGSGSGGSGLGVSNNIIEYCHLTAYSNSTRPTFGISMNGISGSINSNNMIRNNNFYNHHRTNSDSYGIYLGNYNTGTIVRANNFFETTNLTCSSASNLYTIAAVGTTGVGSILIEGNYIGGRMPSCAGSPLTIDANTNISVMYVPIFVSATGSTQQSDILNNVIKNIHIVKTTNSNPFSAIRTNQAAWVNIAGNIIGSEENGKITINSSNNQASSVISYGIEHAPSAVSQANSSVSDNSISFVTLTRSSAHLDHSFRAIDIVSHTALNTVSINRNFIHSIELATNNTSTSQNIIGIRIDNGSASGNVNSVRQVYNNIISLGKDIFSNSQIHGILETGNALRSNKYYFNSVIISGVVGNPTFISKTYAMRIASSNANIDARNNILVNYRSNAIGELSKHYALGVSGNSNINSNFNNYYTSDNTNGIMASVFDTDFLYVSDEFQNTLGGNANSQSANPLFDNMNGIMPVNYSPNMQLVGTAIPGFDYDFFGTLRNIPPQIGAIELSSSDLYTVSINVSPSGAGYTTGSGGYISGQMVTIKAFANQGYEFENWTENDIIVSENHSYSFVIESNRTFKANFSNIGTAVSELMQKTLPLVFPNPANEFVYVNLHSQNTADIIITDNMGRAVYNETIIPSTNQLQINLQNIESGYYILYIRQSEKQFIQKIIIL
jgi:hypothetical protein